MDEKNNNECELSLCKSEVGSESDSIASTTEMVERTRLIKLNRKIYTSMQARKADQAKVRQAKQKMEILVEKRNKYENLADVLGVHMEPHVDKLENMITSLKNLLEPGMQMLELLEERNNEKAVRSELLDLESDEMQNEPDFNEQSIEFPTSEQIMTDVMKKVDTLEMKSEILKDLDNLNEKQKAYRETIKNAATHYKNLHKKIKKNAEKMEEVKIDDVQVENVKVEDCITITDSQPF